MLARMMWLYDMHIESSSIMTAETVFSGRVYPTLDRFVSTPDKLMMQFRSREPQ